MKRNYYSDHAALQTVLEPYVVIPDFLKYAEVFNSQIDKRAIKKHTSLVRDLFGLAPNMAFTKKALEKALHGIAAKKKFFKRGSDQVDWAQTLALRIRVLSRHFQQSWLKARGSSSTWIRSIVGDRPKEPHGMRHQEISLQCTNFYTCKPAHHLCRA